MANMSTNSDSRHTPRLAEVMKATLTNTGRARNCFPCTTGRPSSSLQPNCTWACQSSKQFTTYRELCAGAEQRCMRHKWFLRMLIGDAHEKRQPCLYTGRTYIQAVMLSRPRTGNSFAMSWLHERRAADYDNCQHYGAQVTIAKILLL